MKNSGESHRHPECDIQQQIGVSLPGPKKPVMHKIAALSFFVFSLSAFGQTSLFTNIEAVDYDPGSGRFFISNGNSLVQKMPDGTYSLFGSAQATHGMEVMDGKLFAIKGGQVRAYDLETAEQLMNLTVPGAQFMNGMASDGAGRIWVSDFTGKKIYEINVSDVANPVLSTVVANTVSTPNGLVYDGANDRLLMANWGSMSAIKGISLTDYSILTLHSTGLSNVDGIALDNLGRVYVSSWQPQRVTRFSDNYTVTESIITTGLGNPADICYALAVDTLAVPNSSTNTVIYFGITSVSVEEEMTEEAVLDIFPNPAADHATVRLRMPESGLLRIDLLDASGKLVKVLANETVPAGGVQVPFLLHDVARGSYLVRVNGAGISTAALPFQVH